MYWLFLRIAIFTLFALYAANSSARVSGFYVNLGGGSESGNMSANAQLAKTNDLKNNFNYDYLLGIKANNKSFGHAATGFIFEIPTSIYGISIAFGPEIGMKIGGNTNEFQTNGDKLSSICAVGNTFAWCNNGTNTQERKTTFSIKEKFYTVGKLGLIIGGHTFIYGLAGAVFGTYSISHDVKVSPTAASAGDGTYKVATKSTVGSRFGAGILVALSKNIGIGAEYTQTNYSYTASHEDIKYNTTILVNATDWQIKQRINGGRIYINLGF